MAKVLHLHNSDSCKPGKQLGIHGDWRAANFNFLNSRQPLGRYRRYYAGLIKQLQEKFDNEESELLSILLLILKSIKRVFGHLKVETENITMGGGGRGPPLISSFANLFVNRVIGAVCVLFLAIAVGIFFISGCGKAIDPLGAKIAAQTQKSEDYNFSGDTIYASLNAQEIPYQRVEVAVKKPGDADFSTYETVTVRNGNYTKNLTTSTFGNYDFKFRIVSDRNGTASEHTVTVPVYMNEPQSDAALEQAILEIGVNSSSTTDNDILEYRTNQNNFWGFGEGVTDIALKIRKAFRGPPQFAGWSGGDVQGSDEDILNQTKKNNINNNSDDYFFISPVMSKDEIKAKILERKNSGWPDLK